MPIITMPDGANVSFPDDMPKEQIRSMIASKFPNETKGLQPTAQPQEQPQEKGFLESIALGGGEAIADRGLGLLRTMQQAGIPINKAFGLSPEEFQNIAANAVAANKQTSEGTGITGAITGAIADPLNLAPIGRFGAAALPISGALGGALSGEGGNLEDRALQGVFGAGTAYLGGKALEAGGEYIAKPIAEKVVQYTPDSIKSGISDIASRTAKAFEPTAFGQTIKETIRKSTPEGEMPTSDMVRQNAQTLYAEVEKRGGIFNEKVTNRFKDAVNAAKIKPLSSGKYTPEAEEVNKILNDYIDLSTGKFTLNDLQQIDTSLGNLYFKNIDPKTGKATPVSRAIAEVRSKLGDILENTSARDVVGGKSGIEALKIAKSEWRRQSNLGEIERILEYSKYYDNPSSAIRNSFRTIAKNPKRLSQFDAETRELIKQASKTGLTEGALRTIGNRLISAISGGAMGGIGGVAAGLAVGEAARGIAGKMANKKTDAVMKSILKARGGIKGVGDLPSNALDGEIILPRDLTIYRGKQ